MQELYTEEHNLFRESFSTFLKQEALPHYIGFLKCNLECWMNACNCMVVMSISMNTRSPKLGEMLDQPRHARVQAFRAEQQRKAEKEKERLEAEAKQLASATAAQARGLLP